VIGRAGLGDEGAGLDDRGLEVRCCEVGGSRGWTGGRIGLGLGG